MNGARAAPGRGVALALLLAPLMACAWTSAKGPAVTLAALGDALEKKDYAAAYALTSSDFKARVPLATFRTELEEGGAETLALGQRLRAAGQTSPPRVEVSLAPDEA